MTRSDAFWRHALAMPASARLWIRKDHATVPRELQETDYLVVGGGSGGCAAARILAQRSGARVTVLESGGTNARPDVEDPDRWQELLTSDANWGYETVPQQSTAARVHQWPMGRLLGGSSSVNGMKYMRGGPWDYERWVQLGNPAWEPDVVYRIYRQMEDYPAGDQSFHGTGGPIGLTQVIGDHPLTTAFLSACESRGFAHSADFNSFDAEGYGLNQVNVRDGRRQDAALALLGPEGTWQNLDVVLGATVHQLIVDISAERIAGVRYMTDEGMREVSVTGEVVLAAGVIGSPQLLMLSGMGPAAVLERAGIEVRIPLEGVGQNLHDHIGVAVVYESLQPIPSSGFQSTGVSLYRRATPSSEHFETQVTMHQSVAYPPPGYECGPDGFTFFPGILKPRSRGSVTVRSCDPSEQPLIDPAYLTDAQDVDMLVDVVGVTRDLAASEAFRDWRGREAAPGAEVMSASDIRDYVRRVASTYFHPVGTCRMGADERAVVDHRLKLRGLSNLRVADASIMPEIVSGNTNAPAMMIGWRAAEFALEDAGIPVS
jgi:choline dehydrogenase